MPRRVRITGGPSAMGISIKDSETGVELNSLFTGFKIDCVATKGGTRGLAEVTLHGFAEVDLEAKVDAYVVERLPEQEAAK